MPCYHPLIGVDIGRRSSNGSVLYEIKSFPVDLRPGIDTRVKYAPHDQFFVPCPSDQGFPFVTIPCGKCVGCRLEYSRQWANRCMLELEYHDSAYFVTLTYDDYHVPRSYYPDPETGEAQLALTLEPRDVTLFLKRLRKAHPKDRIRYFYCGEYGPSTFRPHYHLILFGLHLDDLQPVTAAGLAAPVKGYKYYSSPSLERAWSVKSTTPTLDGCDTCVTPLAKIGNITITDVTWEACAYTARYIMKKLKGPEADFYQQFNLYPPFVRMSRMPGLARQWYDDHPGYNVNEYINLKTPKGGKKFRPPKYYDKLFDGDFPEESAKMKEARQRICMESIKAKLQRTDLSYLEYLQVEEDKLKHRIKPLVRKEL